MFPKNEIIEQIKNMLFADTSTTAWIPLEEDKYGTWAIVFGWRDGFDDESDTPYKRNDCRLCGKVAFCKSNSGLKEYEMDWDMPWFDGEIYDTEVSLDCDGDVSSAIQYWESCWNDLSKGGKAKAIVTLWDCAENVEQYNNTLLFDAPLTLANMEVKGRYGNNQYTVKLTLTLCGEKKIRLFTEDTWSYETRDFSPELLEAVKNGQWDEIDQAEPNGIECEWHLFINGEEINHWDSVWWEDEITSNEDLKEEMLGYAVQLLDEEIE